MMLNADSKGISNSRNINWKKSEFELSRILLAFALCGIGFFLAAYGWKAGKEHFFHLGVSLGPAGLVVLAFEWLIRKSLDMRHANEIEQLQSQTLVSLQETSDQLRKAATFNLDQGKLGLVGLYQNRAAAVREAIYPMIEKEGKGIYVIGSTIFGLRCDVKEGTSQVPLTPEHLVKRIADVKKSNDHFDLRILLTHPNRIVERHAQEAIFRTIKRGAIASELLEACYMLMEHGLENDTRLYDGSPTCFTMVFVGQKRMIINPYPYQGEAYNSWAIMVEDREGGIYGQFLKNHVTDPWDNPTLCQKLTKDIVKLIQEAEEKEKKILEANVKARDEKEQEIIKSLSSKLPD
jgi:hypothetical protein